MAQSTRPCDHCGEPVHRTRPTGKIPSLHPECRPRCLVDGCEEPVHGDCPYCSTHRYRWKKYGDPLHLVRGKNDGPCKVEGCDKPMRKLGWCVSHYSQWRHRGEVGEFQWRHGEGGYVPTHTWLARLLGKASEHPCVDCGEQAQEWSYNGGSPVEQIDPKQGCPFVRDPAYYSPRCRKCHRRYDENPIAMRRKT